MNPEDFNEEEEEVEEPEIEPTGEILELHDKLNLAVPQPFSDIEEDSGAGAEDGEQVEPNTREVLNLELPSGIKLSLGSCTLRIDELVNLSVPYLKFLNKLNHAKGSKRDYCG